VCPLDRIPAASRAHVHPEVEWLQVHVHRMPGPPGRKHRLQDGRTPTLAGGGDRVVAPSGQEPL
jgi:hypothetical protein